MSHGSFEFKEVKLTSYTHSQDLGFALGLSPKWTPYWCINGFYIAVPDAWYRQERKDISWLNIVLWGSIQLLEAVGREGWQSNSHSRRQMLQRLFTSRGPWSRVRQEAGAAYKIQRPAPMNLLPPNKLCFLRVPLSLRVVPPAGEHSFTTQA